MNSKLQVRYIAQQFDAQRRVWVQALKEYTRRHDAVRKAIDLNYSGIHARSVRIAVEVQS